MPEGVKEKDRLPIGQITQNKDRTIPSDSCFGTILENRQ